MKKRIISFMTALSMTLMIFTSMPISISAADDIMMIPIDKTNFPDEIFKQYISDNCDTDKNDSLSDDEIAAVKEINVNNQNISDMTGIEYFTELRSLLCVGNNLIALDISKNTELKNLYCSFNNLATLDISKNTALTTLECISNHLTALDVSKNIALTTLDCNGNHLTDLDVSKNTALKTLDCSYQRDYSSDPLLTALDVSQNTALTSLYCNGNKLTALDVSQNTALTILDCENNQLVALDISKNTNLTNVFCEDNKYTVSGCMVASADLPGSFDLSKASNWTNAKIENDKIISGGTGTATYTYACGNGKSETFSIQFGQHNYVDGTCTICHLSEPTAPVINVDNFTYSIFNNTSMKIGDSFTVSYNAANTPPAAKYSFKYKVPKSDGSGYDYYTPVLNNKVNGTDGQEATGLKVTSSTAGDITTLYIHSNCGFCCRV